VKYSSFTFILLAARAQQRPVVPAPTRVEAPPTDGLCRWNNAGFLIAGEHLVSRQPVRRGAARAWDDRRSSSLAESLGSRLEFVERYVGKSTGSESAKSGYAQVM